MEDQPLINIDEAIEHARYAIDGIVKFNNEVRRENYMVGDFASDVHNLSAILKILDYSTIESNFNEYVKSI